MQDRNFGGIVWTNHALERLAQRGIKQSDAFATWRRPEQSRFATSKGAWVYYRTYGGERIEVVAKQNEKKEWIVLSVWSKPIYSKGKSEDFSSFLASKVSRKIKGMFKKRKKK